MNEVTAFWVLAAISVIGALVVVRKRNLVHGVFALLFSLPASPDCFCCCSPRFIAVVQILVYAGAVGILILFAIMLTDRVTGRTLSHYIQGEFLGNRSSRWPFFW